MLSIIRATTKILVSLLLFTSILVNADQDCGDVRMDGPDGTVQTPVYDQQDLGICFAVAVTQTIDAYRVKKGENIKGNFSSPLHVAVTANADKYHYTGNSRYTFEGGRSCEALDTAAQKGVCPEKEVDGKIAKEIYDNTDAFNRLFNKSFKNRSACKECFERDSFAPIYSTYFNLQMVARSGFHNSDIKNLVTKICPPSRLKTHPQLRCEKSDYADFDKIHNALNETKPLPVIIDYCSRFLRFKPYKTQRSVSNGNITSPDCEAHSSIIIGRRKFEGQCQFLIRNSWGSSCFYYENRKCEKVGGQVWIDQKELADHIFNTTVVKEIAE